MGHRALVAYERTDGQYTLHYSHWGAANLKLKHRISAESPFGGGDTDSKWAKQLLTELADGREAIENAFLTADYYADCLATQDCGATQETQVLDHTDDTLVLYSYWERTATCASVPHIALDHLGDGVMFETRHEGRHYTWRLIHSGSGDVAAFFDELEDAVGDCAQMEMLRTADTEVVTGEADDGTTGLSPEQEATLRAAVEHGYYETPREVDIGELATHLDVPRSTLTYRLRRAEEHLAKQYVAHEQSAKQPLTPL